MEAPKLERPIRETPHLTGTVWAMAAIDHIDNKPNDLFTFQLYIPDIVGTPDSHWPVIHLDLAKPGAQAVVSIVAAAYTVQTQLDVFLENPEGKPKYVKWVQASKPPME